MFGKKAKKEEEIKQEDVETVKEQPTYVASEALICQLLIELIGQINTIREATNKQLEILVNIHGLIEQQNAEIRETKEKDKED